MRLPLDSTELAAGARFLWAAPRFLRGSTGKDAARAALRERLAEREASFLDVARRAIFANPSSPYLQLLRVIGCEAGDLERLVRREGLEAALQQLCAQGVYVAAEEMKARRPAIRGSARLQFSPSQFRNPLTAGHLVTFTSGSRGPRSPIAVDLGQLQVQAGNHLLTLVARDGRGWLQAHYSVPGSSVMGRMMTYARIGAPQSRWFSPIDPRAAGLHPRYRWSVRAMRWAGWLAGRPLPSPEHVSLDDPRPIARWMADVRRFGGTPHLWAFPSSAVRICQAAMMSGLEIGGSQFAVFGEPVTAARLAMIARAGGRAWPFFGSSETGVMGYGCLGPTVPDDYHLVSDQHAMVQPDAGSTPLPDDALLVTSLRPTARTIVLNVSLGDRATLGRAECGCALAALGWTTRLHSVRSFEKLNVGGIALLDASVIDVFEQVLPRHFGGGPTDYQLVEGEAADGAGDLQLLVHPSLGPLDEPRLVETFLRAIGTGSGVERMIELQWRQAGLPRVERRAPVSTPGGKIQHLHQARGHAAGVEVGEG
jgi:hypothetical protein